MNKYAAYAESDWLFDVHADDESSALAKAKQMDPRATRVELISEAR